MGIDIAVFSIFIGMCALMGGSEASKKAHQEQQPPAIVQKVQPQVQRTQQ